MAKKMSPNKFSSALSRIEVRRIAFVEISSKFLLENLKEGEISVDTKNDVEIQVDDKSNTVAAFDNYVVKGLVKGSVLFEITLRLLAVFDAKDKPDKEFLALFEQNTLKVITYPYVRHAVQDLTSKMGLNPLILPMWRVPAQADKEYLKPSSNGH
jgi:preprotein translocase subunit SecB